MDRMPMTPPMAAPAQEAESPSEDQGEGYRICLDYLPDGTYRVTKTERESEPTEPTETPEGGAPPAAEDGQSFDSFEAALKGVVQLHHANPMTENPQANFEAGYQSQAANGYGR